MTHEVPDSSDVGKVRALPRYTLLHCNDMGEDYMSRCYMVAKPSNGGEEVMAGKYEWIRADELEAALLGSGAAPLRENTNDER